MPTGISSIETEPLLPQTETMARTSRGTSLDDSSAQSGHSKWVPEFNKGTAIALLGEYFATFIFIFSVCAVVINASRLKDITGLLLGGVSTAMISYVVIRCFGDWSGAHFNPAVTLAAVVGGKLNPLLGLLYWVMQLGGSLVAVLLLTVFFPGKVLPLLVVNPAPDVSVIKALFSEFILTLILILVIFITALGLPSPAKVTDIESGQPVMVSSIALDLKRGAAPGAIAACLGFLCFLGGSSSGGAFNPARATAPALLTMDVGNLWIYWVGDLIGAVFAALLYTFGMRPFVNKSA